MKNINIGVINLIISNKLNESFFKNSFINESKSLINEFLNVVKNSPILQLEFKVINNIENKYIKDDMIASRYIDSNIKLFEIYDIDEVNAKHKKLEKFINENVSLNSNNNKIKLYESIGTLIIESLKNYNDVDVDNIHESFITVLNHVMTPKNNNDISSDISNINEHVIKIAVDKFNDKYKSLDENDKEILYKLINYDYDNKIKLFEELKNDNLSKLNNITDESVKSKINAVVTKINEMHYTDKTINDDIIKLYELNRNIV